jgi:MFS family permease
LPVIVPTLRAEYDLSLGQVGVVLAASWVGMTLTLLPWGLLADRFGERVALTSGLAASGVFLAAAGFAPSFEAVVVLLCLAGATGAAVNSSSGRSVMHGFGSDERGLALGVRQTAIPVGGLVAALVLPHLAAAGGSEAAFLFLAALCLVGALTGAVFLRGRESADGVEPESVARTIADTRLWRLSVGSSLFLYAQIAVIGFGVLFLVEEHGFSEQTAALVFAGSQVLAAVFRVGGGRWSDRVGMRVVPLRQIGVGIACVLLATALLTGGPIAFLVPALILAGGLTMAWNGLSFTAAAELAGAARTGAAIGFQQTVLAACGIVAPLVFAATVSSASWEVAFLIAAIVPLGGWWMLRALDERRHTAPR